VWVAPTSVTASSEALEAIAAAEIIVLGPGSLYTSLLPSLVVPGVSAAIAASSATRIYVANVATQVGETEGYTLSEHLAALHAHGVGNLIDLIIANDNTTARAPADYPAAPVAIDVTPETAGPRLVLTDVVRDANAHHHDPAKLAAAILRVHEDRAPSRRPEVARSA
jgi:uncharacterized cofD-like protein